MNNSLIDVIFQSQQKLYSTLIFANGINYTNNYSKLLENKNAACKMLILNTIKISFKIY